MIYGCCGWIYRCLFPKKAIVPFEEVVITRMAVEVAKQKWQSKAKLRKQNSMKEQMSNGNVTRYYEDNET